jgi:hypothetical protein
MDDLVLRIRLDNVSTYQPPVAERAEIHVKLDGLLVGAPDTLLPVLRARALGRPVVQVVVLDVTPESDD